MKKISKGLLKLGPKPSVALVYRLATPAAVAKATELAGWLVKRKVQTFTAPLQNKLPGTKLLSNSAALQKMDLVVVLGGDGTYLRAIRLLQGAGVPILGINLGSLGFLTPTRAEDTFAAVEHALNNKLERVPRAMLEVEWVRKNKKIAKHLCLNDVVIERGEQSQLINIRIQSKNILVSDVKADGILIASPTGSTAYNLAAGGPLLHPEVKALVVTAIAPHSLTNRPLIMPDHLDLKFQITGRAESATCGRLVLDGHIVDSVSSEDEIVVRRSQNDHWMLREPEHNDFLLMREKFKFGDRA